MRDWRATKLKDTVGRGVPLFFKFTLLLLIADVTVYADARHAPVANASTDSLLTPKLPSTFSIVYPLLGTRLTSPFGDRKHPVLRVSRHHMGVDLAAPEGAPIRAIKNGVVVFADPHGAYGNLVVIQHKDGFTSHYGHCSKILARPGSHVKAGDIIAEVGKTGRVTGAHLHLELRQNGVPVDPALLIKKLDEPAQG